MGARQEHWVDISPFLDLVRLAGEGRLVDFEIVALDDNAIGRNEVAILDLNDVSDDELADLDLLCGPGADDIEGLLTLDAILEAAELLLLGPVIEGSDQDDNNDGDQDGQTLNPAMLVLLLLMES